MWVALIFAMAFIPFNPDHFRFQTLLGCLAALIPIVLVVWRRFSITAALALTYPLVLGLWAVFAVVSPYAPYGGLGMTFMESATSTSLVFILAMVLPFAMASHSTLMLKEMGNAFGLLCVLDSLWLIGAWLWGRPVCGVLDASSLDATFIAMTYPILVYTPKTVRYSPGNLKKHVPWVVWDFVCLIAPWIAVVLSKSSTGVAALVLAVFIQTVKGGLYARVMSCLFGGAFAVGLGVLACGRDQLFNSSYRTQIWGIALKYWENSTVINHVFGAGLGTFNVFGPKLLQQTEGYPKDVQVIWMHNDWLQILFELGYLGFALVLSFYLHLLWKSHKQERWLFTSVCLYGLVGLCQMPLRHAPQALLGGFLVTLIFGQYDRNNLWT